MPNECKLMLPKLQKGAGFPITTLILSVLVYHAYTKY